jgi:hypothetical protein
MDRHRRIVRPFIPFSIARCLLVAHCPRPLTCPFDWVGNSSGSVSLTFSAQSLLLSNKAWISGNCAILTGRVWLCMWVWGVLEEWKSRVDWGRWRR